MSTKARLCALPPGYDFTALPPPHRFAVGDIVTNEIAPVRMMVSRLLLEYESQVERKVECIYFDNNAVMHREIFPEAILDMAR